MPSAGLTAASHFHNAREEKQRKDENPRRARHQDGGSQGHEESGSVAICLKLGEQAVSWQRSHLPAVGIFQAHQKKMVTCITEQCLLVLKYR